VEEIKRDIQTIQEIVSEIKSLSWRYGLGGECGASLVNDILQDPHLLPMDSPSGLMALWWGRNVFLQDGDNLILKTDHLVEILNDLKKTFPSIERITTYSRSKTVSRKRLEELQALKEAGLSRIHIGLETGYDSLLQYIRKGVTAQQHIEAGRKGKASGSPFGVCDPRVGGKGMWREHAMETAKVLNQINPDFIRVRTLKVLKTMLLYQKIERGEFIPLNDDEMVEEERLLVEHLEGITSMFVSDHILNLLQEVEGNSGGKREDA